MRNLRLDLCYDGTRYRGWQRLPGTDNTIQQKLETALSRILGEPIEVTGSGRTDAGTHALKQVANFHCQSTMPCEEILSQLRRYLPEDIGIYSCRNVSERFHARLNAKTKTYRYRLWNSDGPCVFDRKYVCIDTRPVDLEQIRQAAGLFLGEHDFSAFCANKNMKSPQSVISTGWMWRGAEMRSSSLSRATVFCTIWYAFLSELYWKWAGVSERLRAYRPCSEVKDRLPVS